jgi:hypothetical protein
MNTSHFSTSNTITAAKAKINKIWSLEEDALIKEISLCPDRKNWKNIIHRMNNKSVHECISRYKSICFKRGRWSNEEDQELIELQQDLGSDWAAIARSMKARNWKQVRDRYLNYLDLSISNGAFSIDEDILIYDLYEKLGNQWKLYSSHLPGRTADKIKNRYNSSIKNKELTINLYKHLDEKKSANIF